MADKNTRSISVPLIDGDDYDIVQKSGIALTAFVRKCFRDKADELRAEQKKKNRKLKRLES